MRRPISRATRQTRSATTGVCEPSPQCGVTRLRSRSRSRSAPRRTSSSHSSRELAPGALRRREHRTVGGHDAPRDPTAADEEPVEVAGDVGEAGVHRDRQHVGSGGEQRGDVGVGAAVHADGRHGSTPTPSRPTAGRSPGRGRSGSPVPSGRRTTARRSRTICGHCGSAVAMPTEIAATCERTARAATAKATLVGHAGAHQRHAERDRPDELPLDRLVVAGLVRRRTGTPASRGRRRSVRSVCTGANGSIASGSTARLPYWPTRDAGDADQRLGDHALGRRSARQRRDRRDVVLREGEAGRLPRRAVGQAADAGGRARTQRCQGRDAAGERTRRRHRSRLRTIGRTDVDHAVQSDRSPRPERGSASPRHVSISARTDGDQIDLRDAE